MFLKRIELTGFKSFANKTELEFVQGISAVVGPNGSGKSNISDGIRWVLGEQSARSLRGGKMEDVIFAGSDSKKAVNYGEVSLTLDNSDEQLPLDFNEVTVTRRLHRSGDSEYFINKQSCRLRDITELFMDTGIGKEAYSIIGQGRIEEILSTRSEDRRGIFEEASGIVKFKSRKKEAQKKLEQTEQNLLRIHDLISELEVQIDPLREQSAKAILFKQLKDKLRQSEISMYVHQIEQIHEAWSSANIRLETLKNQELELSTIVNKHDAHLEAHRMNTRRLEEELEKLQEMLLNISEDFEKCEGQGEVLKERKRNLEQNVTERKQIVLAGEKRTAQIYSEQLGYQEKYNVIIAQLDDLQKTLHNEEQRLLDVIGGNPSDLEEQFKSELLDKLNHIAQVRNELRYLEQQLEALERTGSKLDEDHDKWLIERQNILERKQVVQEQINSIAEEITITRDRYLKTSELHQSKLSLLEETNLILRKTEQKLDALVSRRDTMHEMQNDYDGFVHGVKEVLKSRKRSNGLQGIHGAVAELIQVPSKVELAIETALGGALQHVVMENEAHSREAITFLKQKQMGRATFLPLDVIKGRFISNGEKQQIEGHEGFVGMAVDLIQFDPRYRDVLSNLLGHVIIAQNLEKANSIAAKNKYRYRVVTLDGDIVHAGGSMTGGSQLKKNVSLLGRQRQIKELEEQIEISKHQLEEIRKQSEGIKLEIQEITQHLEQFRQQGEQLRLDEQHITAEQSKLDLELKTTEAQLALYKDDYGNFINEKKSLEQHKVTLQENLVILQEEEVHLQHSIREAEIARKTKQSEKEELQEQLTGFKVQMASVSQEKFSLEDQLRRFKADFSIADEELQQNKQSLALLKQEVELNEQQHIDQIQLLNELKLKKNQCTEQIDFKRSDRTEWLHKLEIEENEIKDHRNQLKQVETQLHQTEVKANRLDVELENLLKKLSEDYDLSFELAKARYPIPEDIAGTEQIVKVLKRELALLGDVNLGAIEEYQRVSERFDFLSKQKEDLMEAKATLYQVIKEMEDQMSMLFQITFEEIREQFVIVFSKLFGGGRADLILSEPNQLLETGIEIEAQPPGKKLQNLQLLSGGERALTAIALLFAILNVKPVPFCVLDEVEAALDEANVTRFAQYLREFSENTQFIVVTHRKGTMEEADVLYGVTMEEDGVSKLVSVKLEDDESISA